jgi:hypothetical protein
VAGRRALIAVVVAVTLALATLPWILIPDVSVSYGGSIKLSFEDQRSLLEKLNVSERDSFYVIALTTCPWCALQLKYFSKEFPEAYNYCYIDVNMGCREVLEVLARESRGLIAGVPTTLVIKDGRIVAIVVGYRDYRSAWEQLRQLEPTEHIPVNPTGLNPQVKTKIALTITIIALGAITTLALYMYKREQKHAGRRR